MKQVRSFLFNLCFYGATAVAGLLLAPLLLGPRVVARVARDIWINMALGLMRRLVGLTHRVEGMENVPAGRFIIAAKHQSAWETFFLHVLFHDPAVVLKKELTRLPVFGWYTARAGVIAVDRSAGAAALKQVVEDARPMSEAGRPILIFPQGTRVAPGDHRPYYPGVYALYRALDLPVVPVALNSGLFWPARGFVYNPGVIDVRVLAPIQPGLDRKTFMRTLEETIETTTASLEATAREAEAGEESLRRASPR
jgi:1-acyl-sn-glycerol-3-phosphate acyltransferase